MVYTIVENKRVMRFILNIQKGLCYFCNKEITPTDSVISRGVGRQKKKYYHNKCARIVHIITQHIIHKEYRILNDKKRRRIASQ